MEDKSYVVVDFETNGFQGSDVLSVAAIKDNGEEFVRHYYPEGDYNESAIAVNGLTEEKITELRGDADYAEHFKDDKEFVEFMKDADVFVAHNAAFDYSFLPDEVKEQGLEIVDTMKANMDIVEGKAPKLSEAADFYGVEYNAEDLHGAKADAEITKGIYEAMPEERKEPNDEYLTKEFAAFNEEGEQVVAFGSLRGLTASEMNEEQVDKFLSRFDSPEKHEMYDQVIERQQELQSEKESWGNEVSESIEKGMSQAAESSNEKAVEGGMER